MTSQSRAQSQIEKRLRGIFQHHRRTSSHQTTFVRLSGKISWPRIDPTLCCRSHLWDWCIHWGGLHRLPVHLLSSWVLKTHSFRKSHPGRSSMLIQPALADQLLLLSRWFHSKMKCSGTSFLCQGNKSQPELRASPVVVQLLERVSWLVSLRLHRRIKISHFKVLFFN